MKTIAATLKIRGGKEGGEGTAYTMRNVRYTKHVAGLDVVCIEGNGSRPSHKGNGWSVGGPMYTLNSTEVHAVCYAIGAYESQGGVAVVEIRESGISSDGQQD